MNITTEQEKTNGQIGFYTEICIGLQAKFMYMTYILSLDLNLVRF